MQTFTVDIPPLIMRARAPRWIWIAIAIGLAIPLSVVPWLLADTLTWSGAARIALFVYAGAIIVAKEGWFRFFPTRVNVGDDGLQIVWRWGKHFLPIASLHSVADKEGDVVVTLASGEKIAFGCLSDEPGSARAPLRRAIAAIIAKRDTPRPTSDFASRLSRGERNLQEWLAAVRTTASSDAYRGAGIPRDELLRIVEDASAFPSARVGATIALGTLGNEERARIRIAADASALPAVREALPMVASDDRARVRVEHADDHAAEDALYHALEAVLIRESCE